MADDKSTQYGDMLDIIFANRNKAYGAYQLRRSYTNYLMRAFGFGLLFLLVLFMLPRLIGAVSELVKAKPVEVEIEMGAPPDLDPTPPPPPPPPPPTPPPPTRTTVQFVPPVIQKDEEVAEEEPKKDIEELEKIDAEVGKEDKKGNDDAPPAEIDNPAELAVEPVKVADDKVYEQFDIQKMPSFPGGEAELAKFLQENINYPAIARENNIQGTAALSFVVGKDGSITNVTILKDPGGGCGKEAIRVVQAMPKWQPGEANGNPVKVKFTLPVRFRLQ